MRKLKQDNNFTYYALNEKEYIKYSQYIISDVIAISNNNFNSVDIKSCGYQLTSDYKIDIKSIKII